MLKQRVFTALVLLVVFLLVLFWLPSPFSTVSFAAIASLAAWEWNRMVSQNPNGFAADQLIFPLWIVLCCGMCWLYPAVQLPLCLLAAVLWLMVPLWLARRWPIRGGLAVWLVGSMVIVPAWIGMTRLQAHGPWVLLAALTLVWVADIAAYFAGRAFGRHKLAPAISPGKTWEGAVGAVLGGLIYVFSLRHFSQIMSPTPVIVMVSATVLLVAISIIGDLFESMIKRQAGVKDSSQLLPGHGGVLDRIDSLTSTLPVLVAVTGVWPT